MSDKFFVMIGKQCFLFIYAKNNNEPSSVMTSNSYKIHLTKFNSNCHIVGIRGLMIRVLMNKSTDALTFGLSPQCGQDYPLSTSHLPLYKKMPSSVNSGQVVVPGSSPHKWNNKEPKTPYKNING